jgi:beta-N-acetylhexosaminidase
VFSAIDPAAPASTSRAVHDEVLRGHLGYAGLLMSDDLSMKALAGPMRARAEAVIAAGSDLALHCNGDMSEMRAVAAGAGGLDGAGRTRFERALAATRQQAPLDQAVAEACLVRVLALSA